MVVTRMTVRSDARVTVESEGRAGCRIVVKRAGAVAEIEMRDELLQELVLAGLRHLSSRVIERMAVLEAAEREQSATAPLGEAVR